MKSNERLELLDTALQKNTYPSWYKWADRYIDNNLSKRTFEQDIRSLKDKLNDAYPNLEVDSHLIFNKIKGGYCYAVDVAGINFITKKQLDNLISLSKDLYNHRYLMLGNTARELLKRLNQVNKVYHDNGLAKWDFVSFEQNGIRQGQDHFDKLVIAIKELRPIQFGYKKYGTTVLETKANMLPVLIKEWNNALYLLVFELDNLAVKNIRLKIDDLRMFALDRMSHVILQDHSVFSAITNIDTFEPVKYFENVFGVRNHNLSEDLKERKVYNILLEIKDEWHYGYFINNPIHPTKQILEQDKESNYLKLQLKCQLNPELESLILQFSPMVKVLEPQELRERIKLRLADTLKHYI